MKVALFFICLSAGYAEGEVVTIVGNQSMPFNGLTETKQEDGSKASVAVGMTLEILTAATKHGAPEFHFEFGLPWNRAQWRVLNAGSELTAIVPLTRSKERELRYQWIAPLFSHQPRLSFYNRQPVVNLEELTNLKIAVISSSALIPLIEKFSPSFIFTNTDALINARLLKHNRVDAIAESQYVDSYYWKLAGFEPSSLSFTAIGESKTIYIAANKAFPKEAAHAIAGAIETLRNNGELQQILSKWRN